MKRLMYGLLMSMMVLCSCVNTAQAKFPSKPITAYCVFGPGGVGDLSLRVLADYATKNGYNMNVVNMPGGGGAQAGLEVLKARPDGHRLLFATTSLTVAAARKNLGFKITEDFIPVAGLNTMYLSFCVNAKSNIKTMQEWIDLAVANPGKYAYASPGAVSTQRLFMTNLLNKKYPNSNVQNVPFASGNEGNSALLGGHISAVIGVPGTNKPYIDSGDFNFLAVTSPERLAEYPDVPTFAELYGEEFFGGIYHVIYAHKNTPKEIIAELEAVFGAALTDPETAEKLTGMLFEPQFDTSEVATQKVKEQHAFVVEAMKGLDL